MPNPTIGRIVLVVIRQGEVRPAVITNVHTEVDDEPQRINATAFLDGTNDGAVPGLTPDTRWMRSIPHDQGGKEPGTWHWPVAAAKAKDAKPEDAKPEEIKP